MSSNNPNSNSGINRRGANPSSRGAHRGGKSPRFEGRAPNGGTYGK